MGVHSIIGVHPFLGVVSILKIIVGLCSDTLDATRYSVRMIAGERETTSSKGESDGNQSI